MSQHHSQTCPCSYINCIRQFSIAARMKHLLIVIIDVQFWRNNGTGFIAAGHEVHNPAAVTRTPFAQTTAFFLSLISQSTRNDYRPKTENVIGDRSIAPTALDKHKKLEFAGCYLKSL